MLFRSIEKFSILSLTETSSFTEINRSNRSEQDRMEGDCSGELHTRSLTERIIVDLDGRV